MEKILEELIQKAKKVSENAYSPYSHFKVGSALLLDNGKIYTGCNVENASYGLTICAERNAIFKAISEEKKILIVKIVVYTATNKVTPPCGACRQVINEFGKETEIIGVCDSLDSYHYTIKDLLPHSFGENNIM